MKATHQAKIMMKVKCQKLSRMREVNQRMKTTVTLINTELMEKEQKMSQRHVRTAVVLICVIYLLLNYRNVNGRMDIFQLKANWIVKYVKTDSV